MQKLIDAEGQLDNAPLATNDTVRIQGLIPVRTSFLFERLLPDLTGGEGVFVSEAGGYRPVNGTPPTHENTGVSPLDRQDYLRQMLSRS